MTPSPVKEKPRAAGTSAAPEHLLDPETLGDHFDRLLRAAWALCGSREDAEDLVQDTYARVLARPRRCFAARLGVNAGAQVVVTGEAG